MKMRPKSMAVLVSGITLFLASATVQAGDSFFSFSFGYSSHGHYISPYRYVYAPAHFYVVPSPFFFGYTSYYYPVFPYYYTPVIYYRPVLPYYHPYAYQPHWYSYHRHYAYRPIYPGSFLYGYYPYNRYYTYYPYKHYKYHHDYHHDHFHGHGNKKQYAGPYKKYTPDYRPRDQHKQPPYKNRVTTVSEPAADRKRLHELDKYRTALRQNHDDKKIQPDNKYRKYGDTRPAFNDNPGHSQKKPHEYAGRRTDDRSGDESTWLSGQNANEERVERLINRDKNPSLLQNENRNRTIRNRDIITQRSGQPFRAIANDNRTTAAPEQKKQLKQQQPAHSSNTERSRAGSFQQKPVVTARNNQDQVKRQLSAKHTAERHDKTNSFRQPSASANMRQDNRSSRDSATKREKTREEMHVRGNSNGMSFNQGQGLRTQNKYTYQRSMGRPGHSR